MAHSAVVRNITHITKDDLSLTLELTQAGFEFQPGQFVEFFIGSEFRAYSITSLPHELPVIEFLVELVDGGVGSTYIRNLKIGNTVTLQGPYGIMTSRPEINSYVMIAGGVGIAPFRSVAKALAAQQPDATATLVFGARHQEDLFFFQEFVALAASNKNFQYLPTLSQPEKGWSGRHGRVTDHLEEVYEQNQKSIFYLSGSAQFVTDVRSELLKLGARSRNIELEIFY